MSGIKGRVGLKSLVATNLPSGTGAIAAVNLREVENSFADSVPVYGEFEVRVVNMTTTAPPGSPADRAAYVVGVGATGDWSGQDGKVATWDASISPASWLFSPNFAGKVVWNLADMKAYRWDDTASPAAWTQESPSPSSSIAYDIPVVFDQTPGAGAVMGRYTMVRSVDFPANFAGAFGTVETSPGSTFDIDVRVVDRTVSPVTDASIGTVSISTAGVYTFTTAGGTAKQVTAGQKLEFIAPSPSPAEASLAGVSFMLAATTGA